jgi:methylglutaconyl-CoA hydratase
MNYELLESKVDERGVARVILNRPEIHNAFNDQLIEEIIHVFGEHASDANVRLVVLSGKGRSFCAGADLNWMSSMVNYSQEENVKDSLRLAKMFEVINDFKKPIIGKINGHALGGGVGLVAVCDYTITHEKAKFGFTEVRLGLIPAVISPFCINKIGESNARAWFLSGERFDGDKALQMGLIHEVTNLENFEERVDAVIESHLQAGPEAAVSAKSLIQNVLKFSKSDVKEFTCHEIAKKRVSAEGQEGMKALLNKTQPNWMK